MKNSVFFHKHIHVLCSDERTYWVLQWITLTVCGGSSLEISVSLRMVWNGMEFTPKLIKNYADFNLDFNNPLKQIRCIFDFAIARAIYIILNLHQSFHDNPLRKSSIFLRNIFIFVIYVFIS